MNKKHRQNIDLTPHELSTEQKASMKDRVLTALVMASVAVPCLFLGSWFFFVLVLGVACIAIYEMLAAPHKNFPKPVYIWAFVLILFFVYWVFIRNNVHSFIEDPESFNNMFKNSWWADAFFYQGFNEIYVPIFGVIVAIVAYFLICLLVTRFNIYDVCYFVAMTLLLGLGFQAIAFLRYYPSYIYTLDEYKMIMDVNTNAYRFFFGATFVIYVAIGTMFNDIGAYFTGVLFGKNKVNPRISPKKTWEGVVGGGLFSMICSIAFAIILDFTGHPILPILDTAHWYNLLLIGLIMVLLANLGDFAFSAIKRYFGIKDFSKVFRAHGGALDRFDSLIFVSIGVAAVVIMLFTVKDGFAAIFNN